MGSLTFEEAFAKQMNFVAADGRKIEPHTEESIKRLKVKKSQFGTEFRPGDYMLFALVETEGELTGLGATDEPVELTLMVCSFNSRDKAHIEAMYDMSFHSEDPKAIFPTLRKKNGK